MDEQLYTLSVSDFETNPVIGTIYGTGVLYSTGADIEFTMTQEGTDWYILKIVVDGDYGNPVAK